MGKKVQKVPSAIDPDLAALFTSSLPVTKPVQSVVDGKRKSRKDSENEEVLSALSGSDNDSESESGESSSEEVLTAAQPSGKSSKKRKHAEEDDVEGSYMRRLAREQEHEDARRKRQRQDSTKEIADEDAKTDESEISDELDSESEAELDIPMHESLTVDKSASEIEKASRTVFLGNVSTACIKSKSSRRQLLDHLASILVDLPDNKVKHEVESLRFRSIAFSTSSVPKKAAFARKELMDATTKSANAYAVYSTAAAARDAVKKLNGTVILDRHLRVDSVAHPAKIDHRRCVFVGNLGFVDDESNIRAANEGEDAKKPKKAKPSADVEEGLWRKFGEAGQVESVRVPRDKSTRVGKGFAYVQFKDPNSVEKALLYNEQKFPPLLPRKLRVTRAKNISKTTSYSSKDAKRPQQGGKDRIYNPKSSSQSQSMAGRAGKLLGRAGAAQARKPNNMQGVKRSPEDIVFEGHRARSSQGKGTIFGKAKKQGKPTNRSSKRAAAYKASQSGRN